MEPQVLSQEAINGNWGFISCSLIFQQLKSHVKERPIHKKREKILNK